MYELARKRCLGARIGSWGKRSSTAGSPLPQPSPESLLASARLDFSASVRIDLATQRDFFKARFGPLHSTQFGAWEDSCQDEGICIINCTGANQKSTTPTTSATLVFIEEMLILAPLASEHTAASSYLPIVAQEQEHDQRADSPADLRESRDKL